MATLSRRWSPRAPDRDGGPGPGAWLWGWHDVNGFPDAVAVLVNGGLPHSTVEVGAGTIVALLVEDPRATLPAPSTATA